MSTALTKTTPITLTPSQPRDTNYEPTTFEEAIKFAEYISKSDLVPVDYKNKPANVFVAMQHGKELGISPMQAIQGIANINGRPGVFGDLQLAIVQAHRDYEWHKETISGEGDAMVATFKIKRKNMDEHVETFSVADAKKAGLWDTRERISRQNGGDISNPSPWFRYPKRMLKFRARSFGLRDTFADALKGIKSAEELGDYAVIEGTLQPGDIRPAATTSAGDPPVDNTIGNERAIEWSNAAKKAGIDTKTVRAYMKDVLKVETSLLIRESQLPEAYKWIEEQKAAKAGDSKKAAPKKAEPEPSAEDKELLDKIEQAFSFLGMDLVQQAELRDKHKDDLPALYAELNRMADEGSSS